MAMRKSQTHRHTDGSCSDFATMDAWTNANATELECGTLPFTFLLPEPVTSTLTRETKGRRQNRITTSMWRPCQDGNG